MDVKGLIVSLNRMEVGKGGVVTAQQEVQEKYGFPVASIVSMAEVTECLYNREVQGRVVIDDDVKAALDAYYEQYGREVRPEADPLVSSAVPVQANAKARSTHHARRSGLSGGRGFWGSATCQVLRDHAAERDGAAAGVAGREVRIRHGVVSPESLPVTYRPSITLRLRAAPGLGC